MKEAVSRAQVLTRMLKGYQAYFDIEQYEDGKDGLPLGCALPVLCAFGEVCACEKSKALGCGQQ